MSHIHQILEVQFRGPIPFETIPLLPKTCNSHTTIDPSGHLVGKQERDKKRKRNPPKEREKLFRQWQYKNNNKTKCNVKSDESPRRNKMNKKTHTTSSSPSPLPRAPNVPELFDKQSYEYPEIEERESFDIRTTQNDKP